MRIAMIGTRGAPARYGGFETAVEEIGARLSEAGHEVVVYCRQPGPEIYRGMQRVELPVIRSKSLDTLSHTFFSARHAARVGKPDVAFVFNAANSPFVPTLRRRGIPVALHTDGLEWQRSKWGRIGRRYYLLAERLAVKHADALISDSPGISEYYRDRYGASSQVIAYGADVLDPPGEALASIGLRSRDFHLVVARFEPENHLVEAIRGAVASPGECPIVVVGSSPYAPEYNAQIEALARANPRVRLLGAVWDQDLLTALYGHSRVYIHGHSVGGTNPSLLRAMGAGAVIAAWDVSFNREVSGPRNRYWRTPEELGAVLTRLDGEDTADVRRHNQSIVADRYQWDDVAHRYEMLAKSLHPATPDALR